MNSWNSCLPNPTSDGPSPVSPDAPGWLASVRSGSAQGTQSRLVTASPTDRTRERPQGSPSVSLSGCCGELARVSAATAQVMCPVTWSSGIRSGQAVRCRSKPSKRRSSGMRKPRQSPLAATVCVIRLRPTYWNKGLNSCPFESCSGMPQFPPASGMRSCRISMSNRSMYAP